MLSIPAIASKIRYQAEADALIARFTVPPPLVNAHAIDAVFKGLKVNDILSKMDVLWMTAAHDPQAAQRNWIADLYNLAAGPSGTLSFIANRGYAGDGSASYLTTGYAPGVSAGVASQNSFHLGQWTPSNTSTSAIDVGNTNCAINAWTGTSWNGRSMNSTATPAFATISTSVGHKVINRSGSATVSGYRNGALDSSQSSTSAAPVSDGLFIGARNNSGTPASYTSRRQAIVHAGSALTAAEIAVLFSAFSAYLAALS